MKILGIDDSIEQDIISIAIKNDIKKMILLVLELVGILSARVI